MRYKTRKFGDKISHAQNPFIEKIDNDNITIHFSSRDHENRSSCMSIDTTFYNLINGNLTNLRPVETLGLGEIGTFDDCGTMPHSIINFRKQKLLYYTGWSKAVTVPFSFHIGVAVKNSSSEQYRRISQAPIMGRSINDPFIVGAPFVQKKGKILEMYYTSLKKWEVREKIIHNYYYQNNCNN